MLQSTVNLFGDSSSLCIQKLKKILRLPVPQDQLNKLNNIPGWGFCEKTISETSSVLSIRENIKKFSEEEITSGSRKSVVIGKEKSSNNIFGQEFLFFNSEKKSLYKSLSLNSLNLESSKVNKIIKRSSSFSDMEKGLTQNFEPHLLHNNEESDIHFMDSAVQCKMSQSSQSVFEVPLTERMELLTSSKEKVRSEDFVTQEKIKTIITICGESKLPDLPPVSVLKTISKVSDNNINSNEDNVIVMGEKESKLPDLPPVSVLKTTSKVSDNNINNNEDQVIIMREKESSVDTFSKNIVNEESFVSHSIPCAQPCSTVVQNEVLTSHQKNSTAHVNDHSVLPNKSLEINKPTTKRKRYNKFEKDSKKLKSLGEVDIVYSPEQIKSMIELMKFFNKL